MSHVVFLSSLHFTQINIDHVYSECMISMYFKVQVLNSITTTSGFKIHCRQVSRLETYFTVCAGEEAFV